MPFETALPPIDAEISDLPREVIVVLLVIDFPSVDNPHAKTLFLANGAGNKATLALPARALTTFFVSETLLPSVFHRPTQALHS